MAVGEDRSWPFNTSGNYTFDSDKIEVAGGLAKLKETPEPYAWWHLNEASGANAADSSGNGRNGTLINMEDVDWKAGKLNNCLEFDGADESINLGDIANFEKTDAFSLEAWFSTTQNTQGAIISREIPLGAALTGYDLYINAGKITVLLISDVSINDYIGKLTVATFKDGNWHHLVVTYDGSNNVSGITIYIDGSPVATTSVGSVTITGSTLNTADCSIGSTDNVNRFFDGKIDEAVIYDSKMSASSVTSRYNTGNGTESMPEAYSMDEPNIYPSTGWAYSLAIISFVETAIKPAGTGIKYQVTSDDGVTWRWWDGAAWIAITGGQTDEWYYINESNPSTIVNVTIFNLMVPGTFRFKAFLHSATGLVRPELDNIYCLDAYPGPVGDLIRNLIIDNYGGVAGGATPAQIVNLLDQEHSLPFPSSVENIVVWLPIVVDRDPINRGYANVDTEIKVRIATETSDIRLKEIVDEVRLILNTITIASANSQWVTREEDLSDRRLPLYKYDLDCALEQTMVANS